MRLVRLIPILFLFTAPLVRAADEAKLDPAQQQAVEQIQKNGGLVLQIAQNDPHVEVNYRLQGQAVTDEALAPLEGLKQQLVHLSLAGTGVTDDGLKHIEGLTELTRLHLEQTKISDAGLAHLANLKNLQYLNLYGTAVTDAGLKQLQPLTSLKSLYLWQTKVTDAGVAELRKVLPAVSVDTGWKVEEAAPAGKAEGSK